MSIQLQISILVYIMVQAVVFGVGIVLVLATPLSASAINSCLGSSASAPSFRRLSWLIAPRLRARFQRQKAPQFPAE